jgi:hypothetical protein
VAFNRLVKRYHVEVREIPVPTDEEVGARKVDRIVETLAAAGRNLPAGDFADLGPVARRVAEHELRDRIVAALLKDRLAAPPTEPDEDESTQDRRDRPPFGGKRDGAPRRPRRRRR